MAFLIFLFMMGVALWFVVEPVLEIIATEGCVVAFISFTMGIIIFIGLIIVFFAWLISLL
jgi:hypothetical protein